MGLQHGDVIALAASADMVGTAGGARTSFIAFMFEVLRQPIQISSTVPVQPKKNSNEPWLEPAASPKPAEGCDVGCWRSRRNGQLELRNAIFCLEAHGDFIAPGVPSESRQLMCCCDRSFETVPSLRVGKSHQRNFWERIMRPEILDNERWIGSMSYDHFEISALRKSSPDQTECEDWRFQLRVLGSEGVVLNYSTTCNSSDEIELSRGDTITIGLLAGDANGRIGGTCGLHLTFIPFVGLLTSPSNGVAVERPRPLPEVSLPWTNDGTFNGQAPVLSVSAWSRAGTLRPPPIVSPDRDWVGS